MATYDLTVNGWAKEAGISEGTLRNFLNGDSQSLSDRTYELLASARGEAVSLLRGERIKPPSGTQVPVRSYVGGSDEILSVPDDDEPIDWAEAPPGLEDAEATLVRGLSMKPLYGDGDLLFHRRLAIDPLRLRDEVAIVQTKGRKRYIKSIQSGSKKGTVRLVSVNPLFPPIEDQILHWVSPILWVKKKPWT